MRLIVEKVLQPLRDGIDKPIKVTSGLRVPALNKAIGGSVTSQHCKGEAADIQMSGKTGNAKLFHYIKENLVFDQLIWSLVLIAPRLGARQLLCKGQQRGDAGCIQEGWRTRYRLYK